MNLDQQIRHRLTDYDEGRHPATWQVQIFELTTAIRAVLDLHREWSACCETCYDTEQGDGHARWPCPTIQAIATQLGITEKQDETDTILSSTGVRTPLSTVAQVLHDRERLRVDPAWTPVDTPPTGTP